MAKYRFRLATLQKLRETHRDEMRARLAEAYEAERRLQQQIAEVQAEAGRQQESQKHCLEQRNPDVNQLLHTQRYQTLLRSQIATMQQQAKTIAVEIEKRRLAVVEADKQVRMLEKLHERQLAEHLLHQDQIEVKRLDEIASLVKEGDI